MKENIENEMEDIGQKIEKQNNSIEKEEPHKTKEVPLKTIDSLLGQESEEEEEEDFPKLQSIDSLLRNESEIIDYNPSSFFKEDNDLDVAKKLYLGKDLIFMFILLVSSGLYFSWLYFPFLILAILCYLLLFKSSSGIKLFKKIIEYLSLLYSLGLLSIKIYFIVKIKKGKKFENKRDLILDLGIAYLINTNRKFFMLISFLGEIIVIIFSIVSIIISNLCSDFDLKFTIKKNITKDEFFRKMAICIYVVYFMIVAFAIFNRSILTLCYILAINLFLYFLSMNSNRRLLFYIFKILSLIMALSISTQIVLINLLNINSIRNKYIDDDNKKYKIINTWTKIGINQSFHENMDNEEIIKEFFGYFFAVASLITLIYSFKTLTKEEMVKAYENNLDEENNEDNDKEKSWYQEFLEYIKNYSLNPSFILFICRISAVYWLYLYQNFYSIGIIIWLFFSFLYKHIKSNRFVTITFLSPMVIICLFCYHFSNIDGFCENLEDKLIYSRFGINKFKHKNVEYIFCNIFYFLINLFTYIIFIRIDKKEKQKKLKLEKEIKNEIENINLDQTDKNIIGEINKNEQSNIGLFHEEKDKNILAEKLNELEDKDIDELYKKLTINNIILKGLFSNIDKITLIAMYFLAVDSINIFHFILVIIFMIQLLFPTFLIKYSFIMIIFSQIIFLIEYIIHLFKSSNYSKNAIENIQLFIPFESDSKERAIEYSIYIAVYCYYIQYQLFNYDFYQQLVKDKYICLSVYIEIKFSEYNLIKTILFFIGKIILELYIWSLISLFIFFDSYFEISFLFAIKLLIFFLIVYKFLRLIQSEKPNIINLFLNWIFLIFCSLNTLSVYAFQLFCLKKFSINDKIEYSTNFFVKNLPALGFYRYVNKTKDFHLKFLPHFMSNLISVLFVVEMKRLLKKEKEEENEKIYEAQFGSNKIDEMKNKLLLKKKSMKYKNKEDNIKRIEEIKEKNNDIEKIDSEMKNEKKNETLLEEKKDEIKDDNKENEFNNIEINIKDNKIIENEENKNIIEPNKKEDKIEDNEKNEDDEKNEDKEENEDDKLSASQEYENNKSKINILDIKYYIFNIILLFTKFYWLFLFLSICIIFTTYDLSIILIVYILIFGITFIRMFRHIITRLSKFIKEESFFISRLIRYNLIEQARHIKENTKYRSLAFKYLLIFSFLSYYLFYLNGIFYIVQNGCPESDCDKNKSKIVDSDGIFKKIDEELIISISYIFGFDVNLKKESVLFAGWVHLFFSGLICFDVYIQKIEIYFNELCLKNRKKHRKLANKNIQLKPLTFGEDNLLMNISSRIEKAKIKQSKEENNKNEINANKDIEQNNINKQYFKKMTTVKFKIDAKNEEEDTMIGKNLIKNFLLIFEKAGENEVKLSKSNKKYRIIQIIKKIFEELIIFILICTSISKLNIWSFIYMLFALYLILTSRSMQKYYVLYCFIIVTILLQSIIFVSNLHLNTDPNPDKDAINIMNNRFHIPWYKKNGNNTYEPIINISDQKAFFFGFGVSHSQINLIWMDFIEVVIIYIYLDYFSYSIYQENNTIGRARNKDNKINYYNLFLNNEVRNVGLKLNKKEYKKHEDCMKYNFNLTILPFEDFIYYMKNGKSKITIEKEDEQKGKEEKDTKENEEKENVKEKIDLDIKKNENKVNNEIEEEKDIKEQAAFTSQLPNKIEEESPLINAINKSKTLAISKSSVIMNLKNSEKASNKCYNIMRKFIYLSIHNVILIIIIIVSMMISGITSIYYIIFSLYFLITSTRVYLGSKYYYPKAIKVILRISILIDISLQILYQCPYINTKNIKDSKESKNTIHKILEIIGFNKILSFSSSKESAFEAIVDGDQMVLVLAKAFIYLFMSMQVLVYSSQSFQEYYLSYIITKNNNLRRISLMNVFKFNNKRIQVMERSIQIRQEMSKEMDKLQKTLEKWNEKIMKFNEKQKNLALSESESEDRNIEENENYIENIDNPKEEEKKESKIVKLGSDFLSNLMKLNTIQIQPGESQENIDDSEIGGSNRNLNIEEEKMKSSHIRNALSVSSNIFFTHQFYQNENNKNEYLPEKEVIQTIKNWLLGGFLIKIQIKLHKLTASYNDISKNEKDIYEKDTIQGKIESTTYIENLVDAELKTVDLAHFTLAEMKEVKTFFDGTRQKKLEEKRKEKERIKKLQKGINKAKVIGKMNQLNEIKPKKKVKFFNENNKKSQKLKLEELPSKKNLKKNNTESLLSDGHKKKEKEIKDVINLKAPKFKKLEKFMTSKIFVKYLKTSYILLSILKDCIAFCSNNFHWVCYAAMLLNHIASSSIISLFYPLSIFCYALLEYPRPPQGYWSFCFIYTVSISTLKFAIQLKFLSDNDKFNELIESTAHYKLGLKICNSTFSRDFFIYILFDSFVLIILLINNYLLVAKGLYLKREQEIENIYQAMERIAMTKDLVLKDIKTIKEFNDSYLLKEGKKLDKEKIRNKEELEEDEKDIKEEVEIIKRFDKITLDESDFDKEKKDSKKKLGYLERIKRNRLKKKLEKEKKEKEKRNDENKNKNIDKKEKEEEKEKEKNKYDEGSRSYFQKLFPKIRNEKPGNEYYVSYTISMVFIILYLLIFYTTMVQDRTYGAVTVETKQFSGTMVIFLLLHIVFLLYDRILFISQNRNNLIYEYILYDKITKKPLTELEFNQIKSDISMENPNIKREHFIIPPEYVDKLKTKYNIVYIQTEEFNSPLFQKYLLQLIVVIFSHIFIFFFMPMWGNKNLNNNIYCGVNDEECNDFLKNNSIIIFYLIYIIYLVASGLQIKYGFYDIKRKSVLKSKNNSLSGGIYNGFKNVPFLYEIKLGIDWTFTSTCLDLFQWNKFESVYDILYTTNCSMTGINSKLVGQEVGKIYKIGMGGILSFGLIIVLIFPLILFSTLNPMNKLNNLTSADLKVELCFIDKNGLMKNYSIFENSKPQSIESITDKDMETFNYTKSINTKNFPRKQIQTISFSEENDKNWDLSRPQINSLISLIPDYTNDNENNDIEIKSIDLILDYSFYRLLPPGAQQVRKRFPTNIYSKENYDKEKNEKMKLLKYALDHCYDVYLTYEKVYSPPIRLKGKSHPKRILNKNLFPNLDVQLGFIGCKNKTRNNTREKSYLESYFVFRTYNLSYNLSNIKYIRNFTNDTEAYDGIKFHVFSDQVSSTTYSYSVLTFYVAFVLVVGNYVRNFFTGQPEKISLTEMPNNEELLNLCEGIKVSRYSFNFEEEEKLYYILIEIMRSPDYLKLLTNSSMDQFSQRLLMTKSSKTTDDLE